MSSGFCAAKAREVDGLAHPELRPLVVPQEGQHRVEEARRLGRPEDVVRPGGLDPDAPLLPDQQLGDEEHRPVALPRHRHQGGEGVLPAAPAAGPPDRRLLEEDQRRAALPPGVGEADVERSALRHPAPGPAEPPPHVHHGADRREGAADQEPGEVEEAHPGRGPLHVHHEALGADPPQLGLRRWRHPDVRTVPAPQRAAGGAELVPERGLAVVDLHQRGGHGPRASLTCSRARRCPEAEAPSRGRCAPRQRARAGLRAAPRSTRAAPACRGPGCRACTSG